MRELIYTLIELEKEYKNRSCDFCSNLYGKDNKAVRQIVTRVESTSRWISDDVVCEECEEKFFEIPKCERCGRLQTKHYISFSSGKYVCYCIRHNEEIEEKELPLLPNEEISQAAFYERQINALQEQLNDSEWTAAEERQAHEDFMKTSEEWGKRQKQELLDKIKELEEENKRLKELTPQELITEINELKAQLAKFQQQNLTAQIEVKETKKWPWKKK